MQLFHVIDKVNFTDSNYPEKLKHCIDGPIVLFQRGNINLKQQPIISIVGTRKITTHGIANCEKLIEDSPVGDGFMAECCKLWEDSALELKPLVDRLVINRIGIVLSTLLMICNNGMLCV